MHLCETQQYCSNRQIVAHWRTSDGKACNSLWFASLLALASPFMELRSTFLLRPKRLECNLCILMSATFVNILWSVGRLTKSWQVNGWLSEVGEYLGSRSPLHRYLTISSSPMVCFDASFAYFQNDLILKRKKKLKFWQKVPHLSGYVLNPEGLAQSHNNVFQCKTWQYKKCRELLCVWPRVGTR